MTRDSMMKAPLSVQALAVLFDDTGRAVRADSRTSALQGIVDVCVARLVGAESASIATLNPHGRYVTAASCGDLARRADEVQADVGSGPCLSAIVDDQFYGPKDLATDDRWPEFGARISSQFGVHSMLSYRLRLDVDGGISSLNVYATGVDAFDETDTVTGLVLATHGGIALGAELQRHRGEQLETALRSNREIGVAMGVLMNEYKITGDQAFGMLRVVSQNSNRKLRDVAAEVAATGSIEIDTNRLRTHP